MKIITRYILSAVALMLLWVSVAFLGTVEGWFHNPIAKHGSSKFFLKAVETELNKKFVGTFAMAIVKEGAVEFEKFHSVGNPVNRHTVFQVSSLSKWISAFGIMKLVEDGKLNLDVSVSKYLTRWQLPSSEFNNEEVTVRRLLSHTAGLTDGLGYSGFKTAATVQSLEQSLTKAVDADDGVSGAVYVGIKPGSEFKYSGGGYALLQLLVEEVSGQSFNTYMIESIFRPLGMIHSTYVWDDSSPYLLADFFDSDSTRSIHRRYAALAATSLYTSLSDLELFFQAHLKGRNNEPIGRNTIKPETLKMMREPHGRSMGVDIWGLGTVLYIKTINNDFVIGHDGKSSPPINTAMRLNPETGDGIIILETGHISLATKLASEWVFWKTGKVDTFLFPMLMGKLVWTIAIGWVVIIIAIIIVNIAKRLRRRSM